jgi:hypothetical protein
MRPRAALALIAVVPFVAIAQEPDAANAPPGPARWSLGAGVTLFSTFTGTGAATIIDSLGLVRATAPVATASLERRLSDRSWLVIGVFGGVEQGRSDPPEVGLSFTRDDSRWLSLTGGLRRVLSRAGAPVDVSVLVLAEAGVGDDEWRYVSDGTESNAQISWWSAGGSLGLAVERALTAGLSLRVASPLVVASWSSAELDQDGAATRDGSGFRAGALIAPRLELRLAF